MTCSVFRLATLVAVLTGAASAAPFTSSSLVVSRIGDGAAALSGSTAAVFLDEFTTAGSLVQSIAIPAANSGANFALTIGGTTTSAGQLTRSVDQRYLTIGGTNAPANTSGANNNGDFRGRTIARVGGGGVANTSTRFEMGGTTLRSVASTDGTSLWMASDIGSNIGGVRALSFGSTTPGTRLNDATTNIRTVNIFNGQLYIGSSTGVPAPSDFRGVSAVGTGLPTTTGQTFSLLPGMGRLGTGADNGNTDSTYDFYFADANTLYVTDDDTTAPASGGLQKWTLNAGTWTKQWTVNADMSTGMRSITGQVTPNGVQLYAITSETTLNRLVSVFDIGSGTPTVAVVATAPTNTIFRGVEFAPVPEPSTILIGFVLAGAGVMWRRR
jgi:hypothetical protein